MARPLRIEFPGAWYHFTCRGNERNRIFKDDTDRNEFLSILKDSLEKYATQLHGYVLMDNHFLCEASHNISTLSSTHHPEILDALCNDLILPTQFITTGNINVADICIRVDIRLF